MSATHSPKDSNQKSSRPTTINGMALAQAKTLAEKIFGQNLYKVVQPDATAFEVYVYKTADKKDIEKFKGDEDFKLFYTIFEPIKI